MPPRSSAREFAIILFCLLAIAVLNDFSHNKYRGLSDPLPTIKTALGLAEVRSGYEKMTVYDLLNRYSMNAEEVEALRGVAVEGYILPEKAIDPLTHQEGQKVGRNFRLARRFSQGGHEEGSHVLSVEVQCNKDYGLEANTWLRVQGQVKLSPNADSGVPKPMIMAVQVREIDAPEEQIIGPSEDPMGMPPPPGMGMDMHDDHGDHEGHNH